MSVAAQFAMQDHLPPDWKHYSVYAAKVVVEYHNDQGPEFNIHLDPILGCPSKCNPAWVWLGSRQPQMEDASRARESSLAGEIRDETCLR